MVLTTLGWSGSPVVEMTARMMMQDPHRLRTDYGRNRRVRRPAGARGKKGYAHFPGRNAAAMLCRHRGARRHRAGRALHSAEDRSEEHTSELQSPCNLVC